MASGMAVVGLVEEALSGLCVGIGNGEKKPELVRMESVSAL